MDSEDKKILAWVCAAVIFIIIIICLFMWLKPKYNVYSQTMRGKADFAEAEVNRQILVEEARAEEEALQMRANGEAEREKIRADATKYAIELIGESLKENPDYIRWMWVQGIHEGEGDRIYIATEAGLPIIEAGYGATKTKTKEPLIMPKPQ